MLCYLCEFLVFSKKSVDFLIKERLNWTEIVIHQIGFVLA